MPAPTRTRVPPRRSWSKPASMADFLPEHSSTTSTARVAMRSGSHAGNVSRSDGSRTSPAPRSRASCSAALARLHGEDRSDPAGHQRGDRQCADRSHADHHHRVAGDDPRPVDPVEGDGQRLGQGRRAGGARREYGGASGPGPGRSGRTPRPRRHDRALALALRRLPLEAPPARAAPGRGSADQHLPHRPVVDPGARGHDGPAPLVTGHQARLPGPPLVEEVDVGAADATVVDLHEQLAGTGYRHRPFLDLHHPRPPVHGDRHRLR